MHSTDITASPVLRGAVFAILVSLPVWTCLALAAALLFG